ncbi:hypothetical protein ACNOYE_30570 [Nannocystaceae bacterium ST9]
MMIRETSSFLLLALVLAGCGGDDQGPAADDDDEGEVPAAIEPSKDPDLQWKRAAAVEHDLMRALELSSEQLCLEVGVAPCVSQVHLVALGGHDPFGLGLYESLEAPLATTPIALDRVALSGCAARADLDAAAGEAGVVFKGLDLGAPAPAADDPKVAALVTELHHRLLARDPIADEIAKLGELTVDDAGERIGGRDFAVLTCYAIATSTEFLFF